ncbi:fimbrial biogenesis chaperone [Pseudomonas promysalinigenes]
MFNVSASVTRWRLLAALAFIACPPSAQAALTINTTRVVYNSDMRNTSVVVANPSSQLFAVQSWVNTETDDTQTITPLMASPALFRLPPGKEQSVQISGLPNDLPQDRESLFYFNVQEIPQSSTGENELTIAIRTRIKVFYRPQQLKTRPQDHLAHLEWSIMPIEGKLHLLVNNPSPFHYTFGQIEISGPGQHETLKPMPMVPPLGTQRYELTKIHSVEGLRIMFNTVNDYGGASPKISKDLPLATVR